MMRFGGAMAIGVALLAGAGCSGEPLGGRLGVGGTTGAGGAVATGGVVGAGGGRPTSFCGQVTSVALGAPARPDILIVMDRSSSLLDDANGMICAGGCGASSKWASLSAAVEGMVAAGTSVNWGLMLAGSDDTCGVDYVPQILVDPRGGPLIETLLANTTPGGDAPTAGAIAQGFSYLQSLADGSPKYLMVVSDGKSGCSIDSTSPDVAAENVVANAAAVGIPTFVLGLPSAGDAAAAAVLTQMALNGGEALLGGQNAFYTPADNLEAQLQPAVGTGGSCTIALNGPLAPGTTIEVTATTSYGYQVVIPQDSANGWAFTDATDTWIIFSGSVCSGLQAGGYTSLTVDYLCPVTIGG
jgi:hypothetical protein